MIKIQFLPTLIASVVVFASLNLFAAATENFVDASSVGPTKTRDRLANCLADARKNITAFSRDQAQEFCVHQNKNINQQRCLQISKGLEYRTNADRLRTICLFEIPSANLTATTCLRETKKYYFDENGDTARWQCLLGRTEGMNVSTCHTLAKAMTTLPFQERASLYCQSR